jgi:sigma-B regulation protein RsbU (phosphoserine phosphatase)
MAAAPPRVLIADDEAPIVESLRLLLESEGWEIETAASPSAVVSAVERRAYDLLLMDLNYTVGGTSGRDGLDLASRVRRVDELLPIVALTGWATLDLAVEAMRAGVCDLIQKPWQNRQLLSQIERAIESGRRRRNSERRRDREVRESNAVQRALLPRAMTSVDGWDVAVEWKPADQVGGDYYDLIELGSGRLAVCIADVAGKGVPAAILMSNLQAVIRGAATADATPADVCARANRALHASLDGGRFVSLFYGLLNTSAATFTWSNAGHPPPILHRADGSRLRLDIGGCVLGIFPDGVYAEGTVAVGSGDRLVLCTDGVIEAGVTEGEEFGLDRIEATVAASPALGAAALRDAIVHEASVFCHGAFRDDATLIVLAARE